MKASDIKEMSYEEVKRKLVDLKEAFFNLRFQHTIGQLENSSKLKKTRRDIARLKTVMNEKAENNK